MLTSWPWLSLTHARVLLLLCLNHLPYLPGPSHGCYVAGLYLEGAAWDLDHGCLKRQAPKELVTELPILQVRGW
jgi:dynein heavy chain